jgi:hypothetical protein
MFDLVFHSKVNPVKEGDSSGFVKNCFTVLKLVNHNIDTSLALELHQCVAPSVNFGVVQKPNSCLYIYLHGCKDPKQICFSFSGTFI